MTSTIMNGSIMPDMPATPKLPRPHPVFWFHDAYSIFHIDGHIFRIHRSLIFRHSSSILPFGVDQGLRRLTQADVKHWPTQDIADDCEILTFGDDRKIRVGDFEIFLSYMYHDERPSDPLERFSRSVALLRITSPEHLDIPPLHADMRSALVDSVTVGAITPPPPLPDLLDLLEFAERYQTHTISKSVIYTLMTSDQFSVDDDESSATSSIDPKNSAEPSLLPPKVKERCSRLMTHVIDHFAPTVFTASATRHMACTDVFADKWMPLVITPAMASHDVYRPIETLEWIKNIDWAKEGLCAECVVEKREEWSEEQAAIWKLMDGWLGYSG